MKRAVKQLHKPANKLINKNKKKKKKKKKRKEKKKKKGLLLKVTLGDIMCLPSLQTPTI